MIISFEGPVFFSPADEDHFFSWLRSIPEFQSIKGFATTLELELRAPVQPDSVRQLLVVFRRWHLDTMKLVALRSPETDGFVLWSANIETVLVQRLRKSQGAEA
ncbi:hypothetical protein [Stenotrophomonas sp. PS02298]|uniref:hypothetical protein n=1 Tax=Stenotrophomonas sp. PS02298 TaxID=2991424 RepID=UPI00249A46E1|nr:hypothetical protein [Stenotrophomonas sp. PS02298]